MQFGSFQLCYSLNVYSASDFAARLRVLNERIPCLRRQLELDDTIPFAVGLWFDAETVTRLSGSGDYRAQLEKVLAENHLYVFTMNAFPYGVFHGQSVKESVYSPDWTCQERLEYTCRCAEVLASLLPDGMEGSLSTVPGGYLAALKDESSLDIVTGRLRQAGAYLLELAERTGRRISLAVEPEPDCLWECPIAFSDWYLANFAGTPEGEHIGICYDTCHQELLGSEPGSGLQHLVKTGVPIPKIQLSAALRAPDSGARKSLTANFADTVYLHQTRAPGDPGTACFADLPDARENGYPWLIHYHIPLYADSFADGLEPARRELDAVLGMLASRPEICPFLEIETYTWEVLPPDLRKLSLEQSMAREYRWVMERLSGQGRGGRNV